jgi:ABC-type transporter Mla subunit MlaD
LPVEEEITYLFPMSDRSFGYGILLFLTISLLIPLYYFLPLHRNAGQRKTIVFTTVNTLNFLKIQNPVRIHGIVVGEVKSVAWKDGNTLVTVELKSRIDLHHGYRVTAMPVGFMGDCCLAIDPGDSLAPLVDPKKPLAGQFFAGPVDVIKYTDSFREKIDTLAMIMRKLRDGSPEAPPFTTRFRNAEKVLDGISRSLALLMRHANDHLSERIDSFDDFMKKTGSFSRALTTTIPAGESRVATVLSKSETCFQTVDSLVSTMRSLVARMTPEESTALAATVMTLHRQFSVMQTYSRTLRQDGIKLRVRL